MTTTKDSLVFSTRLQFRHRSIFVFDDIIWCAAYYDSNPAVYYYADDYFSERVPLLHAAVNSYLENCYFDQHAQKSFI